MNTKFPQIPDRIDASFLDDINARDLIILPSVRIEILELLHSSMTYHDIYGLVNLKLSNSLKPDSTFFLDNVDVREFLRTMITRSDLADNFYILFNEKALIYNSFRDEILAFALLNECFMKQEIEKFDKLFKMHVESGGVGFGSEGEAYGKDLGELLDTFRAKRQSASSVHN